MGQASAWVDEVGLSSHESDEHDDGEDDDNDEAADVAGEIAVEHDGEEYDAENLI